MRIDISSRINNKKDNHYNNRKPVSFGGVADLLSTSIQFMDANPISSIALIDLASMIVPRAIIDTKEKNANAGLETFRRESSGLIINCLTPGFLAMGLAKLYQKKIMGKEFKNIPMHKIWANEETIDFLTSNWKKVQNIPDKEKQLQKFLKLSFDNIEGADGFKKVTWHKVKNIENIDDFYKKLAKQILKDDSPFSLKYKSISNIHDQLSHKLGASKIIRHADGVPLRTNLSDYIRDTYSMSKAFLDDSITPDNIDKFASASKKLLNNKSFLAMGIIAVVALFTQKVNRHITEKKTGHKGYVGYNSLKDEKLDSKEKLQLGIGKIVSSAGIAAIALASMGSFKPKMFQFSGIMPVVAQSRVISAVTNIGRISEASDKTELKETTLREYLGFCNLYVLGDYVQKLVATVLQKKDPDLNILNAKKAIPKGTNPVKKIGHWLKDVSVKSLDEIDGTIRDAGKLKFRKNAVAISQIAGLAYSCIALGIVVPKICANMVKKDEQKRLKEHPQVSEISQFSQINKNVPPWVKEIYSSFMK